MKKTKVAVIGNPRWQNKRKIQETLQMLKRKFPDGVTILGAGGSEGANYYVRKFVLEFGMDYTEYNPSFSGYNLYSAMPESYYGKKYHFSQLHHRMKLIAQNCDYMMILTNEVALDPVLNTAWTTTKKMNKPVVIIG
jgi:UDP-N-acetylglucosamine:LPS N-acetylglucosamine transferase